MITAIAFIVILGIIIFVHELGHFAAAKLSGVGVEKFAFGFPPRIWSKKYKDTEYKINLIPFGGYVKLQGEGEGTEEVELINVESEKRKKTKNLFDVGTLHLIFIFSAGVVMNILLAVFTLWILFMIGFKPIELGEMSQNIYSGIKGSQNITSTLEAKVVEIEKGTPAEQSLKIGDVIIEVNGKRVFFAGEIITEIQKLRLNEGVTVNLKILRQNKEKAVSLTTYKSKVKDRQGTEHEINRVGIVLDTEGKIQANPFNALIAALKTTGNIIKYTLFGIIDLFYGIFTKLQLSENIAGPIGVVAGTSYYAQLGIGPLVQFAVFLSIGVALFNILPIPALDGGYVAFTIIESIIRKKIPIGFKNILTFAGFGALIILILIVTYRDFISFGVSNYLLNLVGK